VRKTNARIELQTNPPTMEDPKHAAWLAAFDNDYYFKESAKLTNNDADAFTFRIAYTMMSWAKYGLQQPVWYNVIKTLRLRCCSVNVRIRRWFNGSTLLHQAAYAGNVYMMQVLRNKFGASLDAVDDYKCTVLMYAVFSRKLHAVQWLLQQPDMNLLAVNMKGNTAYKAAVINNFYDIAVCIAAETAARARWTAARATWLAACLGF
jgi:ankyrin repeat protein